MLFTEDRKIASEEFLNSISMNNFSIDFGNVEITKLPTYSRGSTLHVGSFSSFTCELSCRDNAT